MVSLVERLFPGLAARQYEKRAHLASAKRLYEAAQPSQYHKNRGRSTSGNGAMEHAQGRLRDLARNLDENLDLAVGTLDSLVNSIVGAGITIEPMVRLAGTDELDEETNRALRDALEDWARSPEVTATLPFGEMQRLSCRTWLRDGEVLAQHVSGDRAGMTYQTPTPYAVELIEADYLPFTFNRARTDNQPAIIQGVEVDTWGKARAYYLYLDNPADASSFVTDTKRVSSDIITHLKFSRRLGQVRGVPIFAAVFNRLDDIRDYEESERIAARVAASFCGYIRRGGDFASSQYQSDSGGRVMEMAAGQIFDNLLPGEEIDTIASNRPNTGLEHFRDGQLRAVAAGTGASASTISRNYDGSYSSQRQELVEANIGYMRMRDLYVQRFLRDIYERFVQATVLSGVVNVPQDAAETLLDAEYRGPGMPWIDPLKEVKADRERVDAGFASRHQIIRERGGDPYMVDRQIERDDFEPAGTEAVGPLVAAETAAEEAAEEAAEAAEEAAASQNNQESAA